MGQPGSDGKITEPLPGIYAFGRVVTLAEEKEQALKMYLGVECRLNGEQLRIILSMVEDIVSIRQIVAIGGEMP